MDKFYETGLLFNSARNARFPGKDADVSAETRYRLSKAGLGKKQSLEWIKKRTSHRKGVPMKPEIIEKLRIAAKARGVRPDLTIAAAEVTSIKVYADGAIYKSKADAGKAFGITSSSVYKRIKSKRFPTWHLHSDIYSRRVMIEDVVYDSIAAYSESHDLSASIVYRYINSSLVPKFNWV